jgi:membrane-bound lytic murein transglycosylase D
MAAQSVAGNLAVESIYRINEEPVVAALAFNYADQQHRELFTTKWESSAVAETAPTEDVVSTAAVAMASNSMEIMPMKAKETLSTKVAQAKPTPQATKAATIEDNRQRYATSSQQVLPNLPPATTLKPSQHQQTRSKNQSLSTQSRQSRQPLVEATATSVKFSQSKSVERKNAKQNREAAKPVIVNFPKRFNKLSGNDTVAKVSEKVATPSSLAKSYSPPPTPVKRIIITSSQPTSSFQTSTKNEVNSEHYPYIPPPTRSFSAREEMSTVLEQQQTSSRQMVSSTTLPSVEMERQESMPTFQQSVTPPSRQIDQVLADMLSSSTSQATSARTYSSSGYQQATMSPLVLRQASDKPSGNRDLWSRLVKGYQFLQIEHPLIDKLVEKHIDYPDYFLRISSKAQPYLYYIVGEIERRHMPLELALLPAIESAFESMALSHRSASGLWQFVPATGREYGLRQTAWYDGRRDIMAATDAALNYLQQLYNSFDGDWFLALAAYNYGPGNIRKAINQNEAQGKDTDFWSLSLPRETREYVPKLLAVSRIIANPQQYGIKIYPIADQPYLAKVNVGHPIALELAAQLSGLSTTQFKLLNAGFRREATDPDGYHTITLPVEKVTTFKNRLASLPMAQRMYAYNTETYESDEDSNDNRLATSPIFSAASVKSSSQLAFNNQRRHRVGEGESLWSIAKHYGTSILALAELNQIRTDDPLFNGMLLTLPTSSTSTVPNATSSSSTITSPNVTSSPSISRTPPRITFPSIASQTSNSSLTKIGEVKTQLHRMERGENLWSIAKQYRTTVAMLRQLNNLQDDQALYFGRILKVPAESSSSIAHQVADAIESVRNSPTQRHEVKEGETIWQIAKRYKTTVPILRELNELKNNSLNPGTVLNVPSTVAVFKKPGDKTP